MIGGLMMTGLRTRQPWQVVLQKTMNQRCASIAKLMQYVLVVLLTTLPKVLSAVQQFRDGLGLIIWGDTGSRKCLHALESNIGLPHPSVLHLATIASWYGLLYTQLSAKPCPHM